MKEVQQDFASSACSGGEPGLSFLFGPSVDPPVTQLTSPPPATSRLPPRKSTPQRDPRTLLFSAPLPPELAITGNSSPTPSQGAHFLLRNCHLPVSTSISEGGIIGAATAVPGMKTPCRKLESEDSSYETDREDGGSGGGPGSSSRHGSLKVRRILHQDLDRSFSETLGREFTEYLTLNQPDPPATRTQTQVQAHQRSGSGSPPPLLGSAARADPASYSSKLEFALKLGYTEKQVQLALGRLGGNPAQNELLEELIKVSAFAGTGGAKEEGDSEVPVGVGAGASKVVSQSNLKHIVIDGSNVAMSHGNKEIFSCKGIRLAVDWFKARGHTEITVFVPKWRKEASRPETPIRDQEILLELERERHLVFTPSRLVSGRRLVCYDDRYVLNLAAQADGIVVSNDNYRDLAAENPEYRRVVEERILMYSFVNDRFMPPDDPLGRNGPSLSAFLRRHSPLRGSLSTPPSLPSSLPPICPYGKKCTYGNKCKFSHPERGGGPHKSVTEKLAEKARERRMGEEGAAGAAAGGGGGGHRKLQRQLTLNPDHDPRLQRMGRAEGMGAAASGPPPPPPLVSNLQFYADNPPPMVVGTGHEAVVRIASAPPDSTRAGARLVGGGAPLGGRASNSDSQLNIGDEGAGCRFGPISPPRRTSTATAEKEPLASPQDHESRRFQIYYHLAHVFPEEHVRAAMRACPNETSAEKICACILRLCAIDEGNFP